MIVATATDVLPWQRGEGILKRQGCESHMSGGQRRQRGCLMLVLTRSPPSAALALAATWTLFTFHIKRIAFSFHRPGAEESTTLNHPESRCSSRSLFCNVVEWAQCSSGHTAGRKSGVKSPWVELPLLFGASQNSELLPQHQSKI